MDDIFNLQEFLEILLVLSLTALTNNIAWELRQLVHSYHMSRVIRHLTSTSSGSHIKT
jgi:hypothetical protein